MRLNEYQRLTADTAGLSAHLIGSGGNNMGIGVYNALGLTGEAGEVADKVKKHWRDGGNYVDTRNAVKLELGDTLWYLAREAADWNLSLEEVAQANLDKLASRAARGVLGGSGDER